MICAATATAAMRPVLRLDDARRFARVFESGQGRPDANQLQRGYLDPGTAGLRAYIADGVGSAAQLAQAIAADPGKYRYAMDECLAAMPSQEAGVAAVLEAYRERFPEARLPAVDVVFGSGNALGLATSQRTVGISLEQLCAQPDWRVSLRTLVAHETAHTLQPLLSEDSPLRRDLLAWALREGAASHLAADITGGTADGADNAWAMAREQALLRQFLDDRQTLRTHWQGASPDPEAIAAGTRWMWNSGREDGGPPDLAYWVGVRIWAAYRDRHPRQALRAMIALPDADQVLRDSGYAQSLGVSVDDARPAGP
ncbi:hypothetical protein ARC20_05945 [Stenotrophomonas panacihumi]|uniref:DUF2268 domain-containing protein n=1 Tax=Stenotrophomonas panacihumi TaxID=676599 RepID=A0A0R0AXQ1_9GAMM|nr:hypothetical protein ARC20_05945 [Stenotrophomonas panacihumi]PTN54832.1 hypothetical protein C9J98_09060 [Stenotrophomonas panacihumi]